MRDNLDWGLLHRVLILRLTSIMQEHGMDRWVRFSHTISIWKSDHEFDIKSHRWEFPARIIINCKEATFDKKEILILAEHINVPTNNKDLIRILEDDITKQINAKLSEINVLIRYHKKSYWYVLKVILRPHYYWEWLKAFLRASTT